ncbi:cytochrome P450 [Dendryphion nanum]|uniref:Cytochrome P450 n=1 Tax=Dendryphion nanum TaxID=256645 RepID=A0A9P9IPJ4_9PLEO|nr:cytochrome P450 [Dendryphion nanum]
MASLTSKHYVAVVAIITSFIGYILVKGRQSRRSFHVLKKNGLPMPEWSWLLGHSLVAKAVVERLPADAMIDNTITAIARDFSKSDMFYLDFWPMTVPMLIVNNPEAAIQANQVHNLDKPPILHDLMTDLSGGPHMFMMPEKEWKPWRRVFNTGFSDGYILSLVPRIVEEVQTYTGMLRTHAKEADMFSLDEATLRLAFDLIGRTVLDSKLRYQHGPNALADAMRSQIHWHSFGNEVNPWQRWHPGRPIMQRLNSWTMNRYIGKELDKRYGERKKRTNDSGPLLDASRSVVSLALDSYMQDFHSDINESNMDRNFRRYATYQIRIFLFAGHDSTSTTICYCFYLLSKNPDALSLISKEHDDILGKDIAGVPDRLSSDPSLLNQLPYTLAVIKETLRLFPPASSMRLGRPDVDLIDRHGKWYPTKDCHVWIVHMALHRNPRYWPEPDKFIPERWLVPQGHPLHPVKGAWRPFEHGMRNCIGQTLAVVNIKVGLALTIREFDVKDAYDEWDRMHPSKGIHHVNGERAYCIERGGMHPADGFPCRVSLRSST